MADRNGKISGHIHSDVRADEMERLAHAASLLRDSGIDALTMRKLAEVTGCPAATLQYQFGSKERLLVAAFTLLRDEYLAELEEIGRFLPAGMNDASALADIMVFILRLSCGEERRRQLAMMDLLTSALRKPGLASVLKGWTNHVGGFWRDLAARTGGSPALGIFLFELHLGLMLHLPGIEPAIEAQVLAQEISFRALKPRLHRSPPLWFRTSLGAALASLPPANEIPGTPTARAIVEATTRIAVDEGPNALSFRTVARYAGTSVSAIAHYFPTRQDLVYATYRAIHNQIIAFTRKAGIESDPQYNPELAEDILTFSAGRRLPLLVAYSELELVAARNRQFEALARYFRMTRGLFHTRKNDPNFDPFGEEAFDSFALSFWMVGHSIRAVLPCSAKDLTKGSAIAFGFRQFGVS